MSEATICRTCLRLRQDLCDGEKGQTACQWYKRMTNADKIRAMTDEELAYFIAEQRFCTVNPIADEFRIDVTFQFVNCKNNMLDWLKQEVSDNG